MFIGDNLIGHWTGQFHLETKRRFGEFATLRWPESNLKFNGSTRRGAIKIIMRRLMKNGLSAGF